MASLLDQKANAITEIIISKIIRNILFQCLEFPHSEVYCFYHILMIFLFITL
jgi:hypothetical protein